MLEILAARARDNAFARLVNYRPAMLEILAARKEEAKPKGNGAGKESSLKGKTRLQIRATTCR